MTWSLSLFCQQVSEPLRYPRKHVLCRAQCTGTGSIFSKLYGPPEGMDNLLAPHCILALVQCLARNSCLKNTYCRTE